MNGQSGDAVDGRATAGAVWRNVHMEAGCFVVNVGEMLARWTNERFRHVVHRVQNPSEAAARRMARGRLSLLAFVIPDYEARVECLPSCLAPGEAPKYEPTWVGELYNWGSSLPIYDKAKQERMRLAQGLYTTAGKQTSFGTTTSLSELEATTPAIEPSKRMREE